jgi:kynurenine formamidase
MIAPAAVFDLTVRVAADHDFLLEVEHITAWESEYGPLADDGWLTCPTGWDARSADQDTFLSADATGSHTPGFSVECARWLATEAPIIGVGVETVGTDVGTAHSLDPAFPCHRLLLGGGKYGLTQLRKVARLPPTGPVIVMGPLPIVGGSGSPTRVLGLVEHSR